VGIAKLKIDLGAVLHNFNYYKSLLHPETMTMVVSKASSYGNGEVEIVKLLEAEGVDYLAVALTQEGAFFREKGIQTRILVLLTDEQDFEAIIENCLEPSIFSPDLLKAFLTFLEKKGLKNYPIHLKIDSGMNRLGFKADQMQDIYNLKDNQSIHVKSVFSHLIASEDESKDELSLEQIDYFKAEKEKLDSIFTHKILYHILNTRGINRHTSHQFDMVRLGIGLYGYSGLNIDELKSVSKLEADILQVKSVKKGEFVGYGGNQTQEKDKVIAMLSIGYADGLSRAMGNGNGNVFIHGKRCPFVGNICMDISMIDVSGVDCQRGDKVEIFGEHILIGETAKAMNTIPYEVFTSISKRVKRVFIEG